MTAVYIRNDVGQKPSLVAIDSAGRRLVRSATPMGIMLALDVLGVPEDARVIESPETDHRAGALTMSQYQELAELLHRRR